jgi:glucose/arabinose dehydrogenase
LLTLAALAVVVPFGSMTSADHLPPFVPEVLTGFAIEPVLPLPAPTALAFGPDLGSLLPGPSFVSETDLYATLLTGQVVRLDLRWTALGPHLTGASVVATGFSQPLGVLFVDRDAASPANAVGNPMLIADSHRGAESLRTDGRITRIDFTDANGDGTLEQLRRVVVDGIPNGRHNSNHMRVGPDGLVTLANGNPNDNGRDGGAADVFPYSGAILRFDAETVTLSPAIMHWRDDGNVAIPPSQMATHPRNADFVAKVDSYAYGFRNIFGVAHHNGAWYTATNGADDPASQDTLYKITEDADHGFPFCFDVGSPGAVSGAIVKIRNPIWPNADCATKPTATALLGWHTCTTGLDFPADNGNWRFPDAMQDSVFVGECATFFADSWFQRSLADPLHASHNTSHKVVRVALDGNGEATEVQDFVSGLALPTDVLFGPDGSMFIADADAIYRVAPLLPAL